MVFTKVGNDHGILHIEYYETTLKKEGVIDLAPVDPGDCSKVHDTDTLDIPGIHDCVPGESLTIFIHHPDDTIEEIQANCA